MLFKIKESLDGLRKEHKLDYEWAEVHAGSLVLKNPSIDVDAIKHFLRQYVKGDIENKVFINPFSPSEFEKTKFIIIHRENIELTEDYSNFESKFKTEIRDGELTKKAENWIDQFPFFDWKIYALKLLSNIIYLNDDGIDKKLEEMTKYMSALNNYVISNIEGIEKSSSHLFYPLNKSLKIPSENFIPSQNLISSDDRSIVFIDDMVGTGNQVINYIKKLKVEGKIGDQKLYYYAIVGLKDGIDKIKNSGLFEEVEANIVISNAAFDTGFIFQARDSGIAKNMAYSIGKQLTERKNKIDPLGYKNSGTLVFFRHNTPNNSLPIFWASGKCKILESLGEDTEVNWTPLFPRKQKPKTPRSESTPVKTVFNVPLQQNPFFTGRENYIESLHETLKSNGATALSQTQAISGLGGIGKTQTAVEYAYKYKDEYKYIFWVNADSKESLILSFVKIASLLNLSVKNDIQQELTVDAVKHWFKTNHDWLLIFDNADNPKFVEDFIPVQPKGHIILTSRAQIFSNLGIMNPINIDEMSPSECKKFLLARTGRNNFQFEQNEINAIEQLGKELEYFPLALEQAGAYIHEKSSGFNDYLTSYLNRGLELLERTKSDKYEKSVATTWSLNFEQVKQTSGASIDLLYVSAFLSPYSIPLKLIAHGANELGPVLSELLNDVESDPLILDEILDPLTKYSLIKRDPVSSTYSIHRMVQTVLKNIMDSDTRRQWAERTVKAVDKAFPDVEFDTWDVCEQMIPHAEVCAKIIEDWNFQFQETAGLLNKAGNYLKARALYGEAKPFLEHALSLWKKSTRDEHPGLATTLNDLAGLYQHQGKYKEAEDFYNDALTIRKKVLEKDDPAIAETLNDLAKLYNDLGKYKKAEEFYDDALTIRKQILREDHPDLAATFNNLAGLYKDLGKYKKAEEFYDDALTIRKQILRENHPDLADTLGNLAGLYQVQGKYDEAEELYNKALDIEKKVLGNEHPNLATTLGSLAGLYQVQGKYDEAEELYNKSLDIKKMVLGDEHPGLATTFNNLAGLYQVQGKYDEAEELYNKSLDIKKMVLGDEHPGLATTFNNLAGLYQDQGKYDEAEELYNKALDIDKMVLGGEHPDLATALANLAVLYKHQGKYDEAEELYNKAIDIEKKVLGDEHPDLATTLANLAGLYKHQGKYDEAEELYNKALDIEKNVLGDEHPGLATTLVNLAGLYRNQGKYDEAEELYNKALDIEIKVLGDEHPSLATTLANLAGLYQDWGSYPKAKTFYKQAIEIAEMSFGKNDPLIVPFLIDYANLLSKTVWKREAAKIKSRIKAIQNKQKPKKNTNRREKRDGKKDK